MATQNVMKQKSFTNHADSQKAMDFASRYECCAFVMVAGTPAKMRAFTCTRSWVCDAINAGRDIFVLSDCTRE